MRFAILAVAYSAVIEGSFYLAYEVRFDFQVPPEFQLHRLHSVLIVLVVKLIALALAMQFGSMLTYFSIRDLIRLFWAMTGSSLLLLLLRLPNFYAHAPPRGVLLVDYLLSMAGLCAVRLGARLYRERIQSVRETSHRPRQYIAIVGAGDAGAALASEFINSPGRGFDPIAFLDDDRQKHGQLIHGVPVVGVPEDIATTHETTRVGKVVIAMPSAPAKRVRDIILFMNGLGLKVETLPSFEEMASGRVRASRIRPVEIQDLLGRQQVDLDSESIRKLLQDRVVLVTGAGGSIGSELCRQIAACNPKRLLMLDQAEGNLFITEQELNETGMGSIAVPLVADILDEPRLEFIFKRYRPEVVFHAAAHKHVYLMERQPAEAIRNNVLGTRCLAKLSSRRNVEKFVFISTDKAINPTSVMGATKRLAELQIQALHASYAGYGTKFMAVRFGNVLGSSGSVIPIFKRQIANGGPVTVTHAEVTRYFMTVAEAVGLVLQSAVMGQGGEIFVLDMGQPVKIMDLATQMIELSGFKPGDDIEIKITGLKPGEKLFEELQHHTEEYTATEHPRIMRFTGQRGIIDSQIRSIEADLHLLEPADLKRNLQLLVPEYIPFLE
jgi:FlaA1/EpsC-like NDP-sugar epimerase